MNADNLKKNIALAGLGLVVATAVVILWFRNAVVRRGDGATVPSPAELQQREVGLEAAIRGTLAAVRGGRLRTAGRPLARAYLDFQTLADAPGWRPARGDRSPGDWLEERRRQFAAEILEAWPGVRAQIRDGDLGWDDYVAFERCLPVPFQREIAQKARADRREIEIVRAAGAHGWYMVDTANAADDTSGFVAAVREALRRNWPPATGLKLVFDGPMNDAEAAAAAHVLRVQVREEYADYDFGAAGSNPSSRPVPESLTVAFSDASRRDGPRPAGLPAWDQLAPITVTIELPKQVQIQRGRRGDLAGFDRFVDEQRAALRTALEGELARRLPAR